MPCPPAHSVRAGYCFGVELTVDNNIHTYLHDQFDLSVELAGGF